MKDEDETFFNARGQEFYKDSSRPVWPHRNLSSPSSAENADRPLSANPHALHLLDRLGELERRTRPAGNLASSKGKDLAAFDALTAVGELAEYVAGWAIDHEVGLALNGLQFVSLQPPQTKKHPHHLQQKALVDQHTHEKAGAAEIGSRMSDSQFLRGCLINLLRCNSGGWPGWLCRTVIEALEALEFGEVHPIFERSSEGNKRDLTERRLMLRAVVMIQFRRTAYGKKKEDAQDEVAGVMGVSRGTVKSWETRLKGEVPLQVAQALAFAENHGSRVADSLTRERLGETVDLQNRKVHERSYNHQALAQLGRDYRTALSRR